MNTNVFKEFSIQCPEPAFIGEREEIERLAIKTFSPAYELLEELHEWIANPTTRHGADELLTRITALLSQKGNDLEQRVLREDNTGELSQISETPVIFSGGENPLVAPIKRDRLGVACGHGEGPALLAMLFLAGFSIGTLILWRIL